MRSRIGLVCLLVAGAVVAFLVAKPGEDDEPSSTSTPSTRSAGPTTAAPRVKAVSIRVEGGKPVGGVRKIQVAKGERVRFSVSSDVADEIHVHGYDVKRDVPAGGTARFDFPATIDGIFVVELEASGEHVGELEVEP